MKAVSKYRYEFWPWYLFFLPLVPLYLFLLLKTRRLLYFTVVNPSIKMGGVFGESKIEILNNIPSQFKPKTIFIPYNNGFDVNLLDNLNYPIILKPDVGERGNGVKLCHSKNEAENAIANECVSQIAQEYVSYDLELGILYFRLPGSNSSGITSLTQKGFLNVIGDGKKSVENLLDEKVRGQLQLPRLKRERPNLLSSIPSKDEKILIEPRGNHCLGTEFINANHRINPQLVKVFDKITEDYNGFYFGRFDLKVASWESLYNGETIKIFEANGVTSEPGHIYDSNFTLFKAYKDVAKQMILVSKIARLNIKRGVKTTPLLSFLKVIYNHFWNKPQQTKN